MIRIEYIVNNERFAQELREGNYIVGRSKSCDIVIRENSISGQHARIDVTPDGATFRDLLSRNGTVLDGNKVTQGKLSHGCTLRLGHVDLRVSTDGSPLAAAVTQPAAAAPAVSFAQLTDDELAPPPPLGDSGMNFAVATVVPNSAAVQVFQMPDPVLAAPALSQSPADLAAKKRVRLLGAALAVAVILVGGLFYKDWKDKQRPTPVKANPEIEYWKSVNKGADSFRQNGYAEAIRVWAAADEKYFKDKGDRLSVGRNYSQIAQVFQDVQEGKVNVNTDWNEMRRKMLSMINDNILPTELREFTSELEARCGRELGAQAVIREATDLKGERKWEAALAKIKEIPPTSAYFNLLNQLNLQTQQEWLDSIRAEAKNASSGGNMQQAITLGEEFFRRGGKDDAFSKELNEWRTQVALNRDMAAVRKAIATAVTAQEIQNARQLVTNLQQRFPDRARVQSELPGLLRGLNERLFVLQGKEMYKTGNSKGLREHADKGKEFAGNAEFLDVMRRFEAVSTAKTKADAAESAGDLEAAISQWKTIVATENDKDNRYLQYAQAKLAQYPAEEVGKRMVEEAVKEHNARKFKHARELLTKAKGFGADVTEPLAALHKTGRLLFNQGVNSYLNKEYMRAYNEINDALQCFAREDEFYAKIADWMQKNSVDVRD